MPDQTAQGGGSKKIFGGVLAGCGCLLFLIAIGMIGFAILHKAAGAAKEKIEQQGAKEPGSTLAPEETATAAEEGENFKNFVNSPEGRSGNLKENYVDFHFKYPAGWKLSSNDPDEVNFASAERSSNGQTLENMNIGYFQSTGSEEGDQLSFPKLVQQFEAQFSKQFPGLRKISEGPDKIGSYSAYRAMFESELRGGDGKTVHLWIRADMIPNPDRSNRSGVSMLMFATSLAPEITSADEVGAKGELPILIKSFRFGKE
jgi:hypothetical protein